MTKGEKMAEFATELRVLEIRLSALLGEEYRHRREEGFRHVSSLASHMRFAIEEADFHAKRLITGAEP